MEKDEAVFSQHTFAKTHFIVGIVFLIYALIQLMSRNTSYEFISFLCIAFMLLLDICFFIAKLNKYIRIKCGIRSFQLIVVSYAFLMTLGDVATVFWGLLLMLLMLELILTVDFTDSYTRKMTLLLTALPGVIIMMLYLVIEQKNQEALFAMVCVLTVIIFTIGKMSTMAAEQIIASDKKYFEQRRLAESTREAINALKIQQEKVKKANEELGVQKIKLEAAYNKINSVNTEMNIQNLILKYISSSLEINTLMELITESILEASGLHICAIVLQPTVANAGNITFKIRTRLSGASETVLSDYIMQGGFDSYINSKKIYVDNRVQMNQYPFLIKRETESLLIIPLVMGGEAIGALICGHSQYDFFGDNKEFFENIVAQFLIALHNADMYSKMEHMAKRDFLTGIYNRGHLNALVDKYFKIASQHNSPLTVALIDIDRFKRINDAYGHLFGDEIIKKIAEFANEVATKYGGIAARYGGEEFVMVFPDRKINECIEFVEEMRSKVIGMKLVCDGHVVTARVSVGIASYPETCQRVQELLGRADGAMYYSKNSGRDRVSVDTKEIQEYVRQHND